MEIRVILYNRYYIESHKCTNINLLPPRFVSARTKIRNIIGFVQTRTRVMGREVTYYQLNLTPEQIDKLKNILENIAKDPGKYRLLAGNQCTSVAINSLIEAGVQIKTAPTMEGNKLTSGYGLSPNNVKTIFNNPINKNLITRVMRFVVGK